MRKIVWLTTVLAMVGLSAPLPAADECCFTNPRYTGVCKVEPGEDETCADILAYLNTMNSVGKVHCGNTIIRGGWSQVDCEEGEGRTACEAEAVEAPPAVPEMQTTPAPQ